MIRRAHDGWEVLRDGRVWAWSRKFCWTVNLLRRLKEIRGC